MIPIKKKKSLDLFLFITKTEDVTYVGGEKVGVFG